MYGVGLMQVHEIRGHRLVYKAVVEALSNYKKSSGNLGISHAVIQLVVNGLKKNRLEHLPNLYERRE